MNENERKRSHIFELLQNARDYISDNFESSQEKNLALTKLDGALLWVEAYEHNHPREDR